MVWVWCYNVLINPCHYLRGIGNVVHLFMMSTNENLKRKYWKCSNLLAKYRNIEKQLSVIVTNRWSVYKRIVRIESMVHLNMQMWFKPMVLEVKQIKNVFHSASSLIHEFLTLLLLQHNVASRMVHCICLR